MKRARRWLYLAHRWLGIVLCLFMALWFVSGVVMMYVGYPKLTPSERWAHLPDLELPADCCISPQRALLAARALPALVATAGRRSAGTGEAPELRLAMIGGRPFWLVAEPGRGQIAVDAGSAAATVEVDAVAAAAIAARFAVGATPRFVETRDRDIFTVSRSLDGHRPLHRFALDDVAGTELYLSSRTGEVVRDSTRSERAWNYLGAIIHWLYPLKGEWFDSLRPDVIIYLSLAGSLLALFGILAGIWRWRFTRRYGNGRSTPYRAAWMRWHHIAGLLFGAVVFTWVFSGMLSMNPWRIFDSGARPPDGRALAGIEWARAKFERSPAQVLPLADFPVRELVAVLFDGATYYLLYAADGRSLLVPATGEPMVRPRFSREELAAVAARLLPGRVVVRSTWLEEYDRYYYPRQPHTMTGHQERRLPILRVEYDDPEQTWIHLDPHTGRIYNRLDRYGRVKRWLFAFLHSFDAPVFIGQRPLWDIVLILLSAGGMVVCLSGAVIGWRRLRRP